jgi:hypothetical protein
MEQNEKVPTEIQHCDKGDFKKDFETSLQLDGHLERINFFT